MCFHKKKHFFLRNKNMSHIVSDIVAGVGAPRDHSKSSKSMIFDKNQWKSMIFMDLTISIYDSPRDNYVSPRKNPDEFIPFCPGGSRGSRAAPGVRNRFVSWLLIILTMFFDLRSPWGDLAALYRSCAALTAIRHQPCVLGSHGAHSGLGSEWPPCWSWLTSDGF